MNKTVLYVAMSLDGYLADEKGGVDWLQGDGSDPNHPGTYPSFLESVDTIVMGQKTYAQIVNELSPRVWPYSGKECHVVTHRTDWSDSKVSFWNDWTKLVACLQAQPQRTIWICGGSSIVAQCLRDQILDELRIAVIPVLLGQGISLFQSGFPRQLWKLEDTVSYNGIVELQYKRRSFE